MDSAVDLISPMRSENLQVVDIVLHGAYIEVFHQAIFHSHRSIHQKSQFLSQLFSWNFKSKQRDRL